MLKAEYQAFIKTKIPAFFVEMLTIFVIQRQNYKFFLIQQSTIPTFYALLSNAHCSACFLTPIVFAASAIEE